MPSREERKLQASIRSLQSDLAAVVSDLEQIAVNGKDVGMQQTKAQLGRIQTQLGEVADGAMGSAVSTARHSGEALKRSVAARPVASIAAAFAAGIVAGALTRR